MIKRFALAFVMLAFTAVSALAAPIPGKVASISGNKVQIALAGESQAWVKKGAPVKIKGGSGTITEVVGATVTVSTNKASSMKVGDQVTIDKGRAASGC